MRGAPPVQMACGRDARWHAAECGVAALAAACLGYGLSRQLNLTPGLPLPAAAALALAAPVAWWRWVDRRPRSMLVWDGTAWSLDGKPGDVELMADLGRWMLLRFSDHEGARPWWLPMDLRRFGAAAHLCRAVIHAHAGALSPAHAGEMPRSPHG